MGMGQPQGGGDILQHFFALQVPLLRVIPRSFDTLGNHLYDGAPA